MLPPVSPLIWGNDMVICIEYWKGDTFLTGNKIPVSVLKQQLDQAEGLYDRVEDNFVFLLCRMYGWDHVDVTREIVPDFTYDRDTGLIF